MDHTDILIRAAREAIGMLMALEGIRAADDARRQLAGAINAVETARTINAVAENKNNDTSGRTEIINAMEEQFDDLRRATSVPKEPWRWIR